MGSAIETTDIHIHLLPGIDDGPRSMEESLALLKSAWASGTRRFCATPHFGPPFHLWSPREVLPLLSELRARAQEAGCPAEIRLGAEVALFPEMLQRAEEGSLPTLGGGRYVLLETPVGPLPPHFAEFLFRFRATGLIPVLAHPERSENLMRAPDRLGSIVAAGVRVQLTAGSLTGEAGRKVRRTARTFLANGWVHAIASDGHGTVPRLLDLSEAETIAAGILEDRPKARALVTEGPWKMMGGSAGSSEVLG